MEYDTGVVDVTISIDVERYNVKYFSKHPLASAAISFMDADSKLRGAIWFYDSGEELPNDELCEDEDGLHYIFGYSTMDHFKNVMEMVRNERVVLRGNADFMWLETEKECISGECREEE